MDACKVLVVEDDPDINALLAKIATRAGYEAVQAFSGTEALLRVEREAFGLVLLDLMLPGMDGKSFISQVREGLCVNVPIIVVSAKAGLADKVDVLSLGADDYVTKPFEPEEVAARMQAVLRRSQRADADAGAGAHEAGWEDGENREPAEVFHHRALTLDPVTRRVFLENGEVQLTGHEFDILHVLIQSPDKVFSRELLYELVWKNGYYGEDNAVNVHVSNIRKKLATLAPEDEYIKTVWGIGFKLA